MIGIDESIDALQPGGKEKQREKMPSNSIAYCISRKRTCPEAWKYEDLIKKPTTKEKSEALFLEKQRTNVNSSSSTSFFVLCVRTRKISGPIIMFGISCCNS